MRTWMLLPLAFMTLSCANDEPRKLASSKSNIPQTNVTNWEKDVLSVPGPVLVDFTAPWCQFCVPMEPILENLAKEFQVRQVDYDSNKPLVARLGIQGIPALFIFVDGKQAKRYSGVTPESVLRRDLLELSRK